MKFIPLTQDQQAIVSDHWYEHLAQWKWYAVWSENTGGFYAVRTEGKWPNRKRIWMHKVVAETPDGMICDHIHHNTLDNREEELRNVTLAQNAQNCRKHKNNCSGYKGVSWIKRARKFVAQIERDGRGRTIGYFDDPIEAAKAYDEVAKEYFGEFAHTNF